MTLLNQPDQMLCLYFSSIFPVAIVLLLYNLYISYLKLLNIFHQCRLLTVPNGLHSISLPHTTCVTHIKGKKNAPSYAAKSLPQNITVLGRKYCLPNTQLLNHNQVFSLIVYFKNPPILYKLFLRKSISGFVLETSHI